MTVSINPRCHGDDVNNANDVDDDCMKDAIDHVFTAPVQTLEELQNSFFTHPTVQPLHNFTEERVENSVDAKAFEIPTTTVTENDDIDEISLDNDNVILSHSPCDNKNTTRHSIAKVDNFVDGDDVLEFSSNVPAETLDFLSLDDDNKSPTVTNEASVLDNNKVMGNETYENTATTFKVTTINTIHEGDPLPGEAVSVENSEMEDNSAIQKEHIAQVESTERQQETLCHDVTHECYEDEVVEFVLDDNFDYEHTRHTPKFDNAMLNMASRTVDKGDCGETE